MERPGATEGAGESQNDHLLDYVLLPRDQAWLYGKPVKSVLGMYLEEVMAARFDYVTCEYICRHATHGKIEFPDVTVVARDWDGDLLDKRLAEQCVETYLRRVCTDGVISPDTMPAGIACHDAGEVFAIPPTDARTGLASVPGARGWRNGSNKALVKYDILGPYQCLQMSDKAYQDTCHGRRRHDQEPLTRKLGRSQLEVEQALEMYAVSGLANVNVAGEDHPAAPFVRRMNETPLALGRDCMDLAQFVYSGFGYANEIALINDAAVSPFADIEASKHMRRMQDANCMLVEVLVLGWPFLFAMVTRDVQPGEEFLLDYGWNYWSAMRDLAGRIEASR